MDAFRLIRGSRELRNERIMGCLMWLRSRKAYANAGIVYICENLPGPEGADVAYQMRNVAGVITMSEFGRDKRPGVPKSPETTVNMVQRMRNMLNSDALHLAADLATFDGASPEPMVDKLCEQLLAFERAPIGGSSTQFHWTGKRGLSGRDDLAVAAMMPGHWIEVFHNSSDYASFRSEINQFISYVPAL